MTELGEAIIRLHSQGFTYRQIETMLGCARSTCSYYLGEGQKEKSAERQQKIRMYPLYEKARHFSYSTRSPEDRKTFRDKCRDPQRQGTYITVEELESLVRKALPCYLCGEPIDYNDMRSWSLDHIIPRSLGGLNSIDNAGLTHRRCNQSKTDIPLYEFRLLCAKIAAYSGT